MENIHKNHNVGPPREDSKLITELQCEPEQFKERIIFMSMYNDIVWQAKGKKSIVNTIHRQLRIMLANSLAVIGLSWGLGQNFLGPGSEQQWYGTYTDKPNGSWDRMAGEMMANFSGSGHPIFRASSALERGELRSKAGGKKSIHFNGSNETTELLLRSVISANQLSIFGARADLCDEVPNRISAPVKPAAPEHLEKVEIPTALFKAENSTNEQQWRNLRQEFVRKFEQLSDDQKLSKLCSDAGLTSSNFAKILPNNNSLTAMLTRTTVTSPQSLDTWSIRTEALEQSRELLKDKRCTTVRSKCLKRPDRESTEDIPRYSHDGTLVMNAGSHYLTSD